ncbi:hypothetical protein Tco_0550192 [Tanacetum coccineum]
MEAIHPTVADLLGTGAKYQVDQTQSTRLRCESLSFNKYEKLKKVRRIYILKEAGEETQDSSIAETHHQSPPPQADKPQSSHVLSTEASDTDSSSDNIIKKYDNILPLTKCQLVKYLRKMSNALFAKLTKDNWEKHEEAAFNYDDLKASIDDYYDENIAHRDQTNNLVEASMSSLYKSSNTISDLYKCLNMITELLKEIKNAIKDDSAHALKQDEELAAWAKSSTNMA